MDVLKGIDEAAGEGLEFIIVVREGGAGVSVCYY